MFRALYNEAFGLRPVARRVRARILLPVRLEAATHAAALAEVARAVDSHTHEISALHATVAAARSEHAAALAEVARAVDSHTHEISASHAAVAAAQSDAVTQTRNDLSRLAQHVTALRDGVETLNARVKLQQQLLIGDPQIPLPPEWQAGPAMVSIVLPTHNRALALVDAIESVRAQTFKRWELIIVNDGSTDGTELALRHFDDDARIRVVRQEQSGVSAARNRGLVAAQSEFVSFLDSDCLYYPGFLAAAVQALQKDLSLSLVYGALITDTHSLRDGGRILFRPFEREALREANFIDTNAFLARRDVIQSIGGFDEAMDRLVDWDLVLRATRDRPAKGIPVLAARYRVVDKIRITDSVPAGPNAFRIRRKLQAAPVLARQPRVLYLVWHYPQLSESYVETEIRVMRRWGIDIAVWSKVNPASPYDTDVPVFSGRAEDAIRAFRPDLIHIHWLTFGLSQRALLEATGIPVTLRAHGFEVSREVLLDLLAQPWVRGLYSFPHQIRLLDAEHPRVRSVPSAFNTKVFTQKPDKNRRLVVRTAAALPSKELGLFFEVATRRPEFRFVLAAVTCNDKEAYVGELREINARLGSPVDLQIDVPRERVANLLGEAGLYLHTLVPPGGAGATPIGMPISIAEAMATGAIPIVRDLPELSSYVGDAGLRYTDLGHLDRLLAEVANWSDARWRDQWRRSVDRAFNLYPDETALRSIYDDWISMLRPRLQDLSSPGPGESVSNSARSAAPPVSVAAEAGSGIAAYSTAAS